MSGGHGDIVWSRMSTTTRKPSRERCSTEGKAAGRVEGPWSTRPMTEEDLTGRRPSSHCRHAHPRASSPCPVPSRAPSPAPAYTPSDPSLVAPRAHARASRSPAARPSAVSYPPSIVSQRSSRRKRNSRSTPRLVAHEHIHAPLDERSADAAGQRRVHAADDLHVERAPVRRLAVELGNRRLRVLLVLIGEADDGVGGRRVQDGVGDGAAALEDGLWVRGGACQL